MARLSPLARYVSALCAVAFPVFVWALASLRSFDLTTVNWLFVALLTVALFLGEAVPIRVGGGSRILLTLTGGFSLALVLVAPLGVALMIDILCLLVIDVYNRSRRIAIFFNVGIYVLSLTGAALAFRAVAGVDTVTEDPSMRQILGVVVAAGALVAINHVLGAIWDARTAGQPMSLAGLRLSAFTGLIHMMDLAYGPMALALLHFSPLLLPLVILPALTLHKSAVLAGRREHEAMHDVLTGLPNRAMLNERFDRIARGSGQDETQLAVMLIDLDHFKQINDTLGHQAGDQLLCDIAVRLTSAVRDGDTVARLGGDEFAILAPLTSNQPRAEAEALAARLIGVLGQPSEALELRTGGRASLGLAVAPEDGVTAEDLMSRADIAMYVAKETRGCWAAYDAKLEEVGRARLALLGELREGLENHQLMLHVQPVLDLRSGQPIGVEAHVRWQHPSRGLLDGHEFLPWVEGTALAAPLAYDVCELALTQCRRWLDAGSSLPVSVDLSAARLTDGELPNRIEDMLQRLGVPPRLLLVEVSEAAVMHDVSASLAALHRLRSLGVEIAVGDYDTSHSSIAFLRQLRPTELKISRAVLQAWEVSADDAVISATIQLAHILEARVVAVGVRTERMRQQLSEMGCDAAQGEALCTPLVGEDIDAWVRGHAQAPASAV